MFSRRTLLACVIVALVMTIVLPSCREKEPVVATFHGGNITLKEFKDTFSRGRRQEDLASADLEEMEKKLEGMIIQRLKVLVAYERHLDRDSAIVEMVEPMKQHFMLQQLFQKEILDNVITERDIRDFYTKMGYEVVFRNIFFECARSEKPERIEEVKAKAEEVLQQLRRGADFAETAKKYSQDPESAANGGLVGVLTYQRTDDPVQETVFNTRPGRISDVIRNNRGFNIIKVDEIRERKRPSFDEARREIVQSLRMERQRQINVKTKSYQDDLIKRHEVTYDDKVIDAFSQMLTGYIEKGIPLVMDTLAARNPEMAGQVLANYKGGSFTVSRFMDLLRSNGLGREGIIKADDAKRVIDNTLLSDFLIEKAEQKGMLRNKKQALPYYNDMEALMVRQLDRSEFGLLKDFSDEELIKYFEENKETKYMTEEKRKVQEIMLKDSLKAAEVYALARKTDFGTLAARYTERKGYDKRNGILGVISRSQWGEIGEKAFMLQAGQISEPVALEKGGFSVIKVLEIQPAHVEPFDGLKSRVRRDMQNAVREAQESEWYAVQKKRYHVHIEEKVLANAFKAIS